MRTAGIINKISVIMILVMITLIVPVIRNNDNNVDISKVLDKEKKKTEVKHLKKSTGRNYTKFKTEKEVNDYLDGYGDYCKKDITSYIYLNGYDSQSDMFKASLNRQWKIMPDKIRDMICYCKIPIKIVKNIKDARGSNGITRSYFSNEKSFYSEIELRSNEVENNALIHECAHAYDDYLYKYLGITSHRKIAKKLYKENPEMYGFYGSTGFEEFYAEMTCNETLRNIETISVSSLADYVIKHYKITCKIKKLNNISTLRIKIPDLTFELDIEPITINGKDYYNGKEENDFLNYTGKKIAEVYGKREEYKGKFENVDIKIKF